MGLTFLVLPNRGASSTVDFVRSKLAVLLDVCCFLFVSFCAYWQETGAISLFDLALCLVVVFLYYRYRTQIISRL